MTHGFALQVKVALVTRNLKVLLATEKKRASAESAGAVCSIIPFTAACNLAPKITLMFSNFKCRGAGVSVAALHANVATDGV
jgi:hypothetical protein